MEKRAAGKRKLISSKSAFTYYWDAFESDYKSSNKVTIRTCDRKPIATVNKDFAIEMKTEGTGVSKSGRVFNFGAANDLRLGTKFYIPKLDGMLMPGGVRHNGCVEADDEGHGSVLEKRAANKGKLLSSKAEFTYYWVVYESDYKSSNQVTIRTCDKKPIATVNRDFAIEMKTEGTGVSKSGKVLNFGDCDCDSGFNCFIELKNKKHSLGISSSQKPLIPFVTIAANDIRLGSKVYIPKLDGMIMPGGIRHNGCVKADDQGRGFGGKHIDFFVGKESNYKDLIKQKLFTEVEVFCREDCIILNYTKV
ncbi:6952_t:CDS:2 [Funneliformis geosporum]|uniref:3508_t:CDS:1 n=1 Tax=Funneliformis geosporum TaxID=1117311 RepID=A0A9W4SE95_9GLOM|nr:6952_t:CDS:2 [Funneliformis geosporum]CAI2165864.1 3508_t:CDS:2 [Funneliformis geosporum]